MDDAAKSFLTLVAVDDDYVLDPSRKVGIEQEPSNVL